MATGSGLVRVDLSSSISGGLKVDLGGSIAVLRWRDGVEGCNIVSVVTFNLRPSPTPAPTPEATFLGAGTYHVPARRRLGSRPPFPILLPSSVGSSSSGMMRHLVAWVDMAGAMVGPFVAASAWNLDMWSAVSAWGALCAASVACAAAMEGAMCGASMWSAARVMGRGIATLVVAAGKASLTTSVGAVSASMGVAAALPPASFL